MIGRYGNGASDAGFELWSFMGTRAILGTMTLPERAVEVLLQMPVVGNRRVHAVWLFGSHATGEATPDSDLDLAVLSEPPLGLDRAVVMDQVARILQVDVDVIDMALASPSLAWEIVTTGRLLVERSEEVVERFARMVRFRAEDAESRDRMVVLAQIDRLPRDAE